MAKCRKTTYTMVRNKKIYGFLKKILIILFWIFMWQMLYMAVGEPLFLAGPADTFKCLLRLLGEGATYLVVLKTMRKIFAGFASALILAVPAAYAAWRVTLVREALAPFLSFLKAVPIASVIILLLAWFSSAGISFFVAGFVAFPIIYFELLASLEHMDVKLLEVLSVFRVSGIKGFRYVYFPALCDGLMQTSRVAAGMCVRAGIAAELIGVPMHSLGEKLYKAKLYLEIDDLFAWTVIIVAAGYLFERLFVCCIRRLSVLTGADAGEGSDGNEERRD